jgi:hypothetical protein
MAEQLHLWGDHDAQEDVEFVVYPVPPDPPPDPPRQPSELEQDLKLLFLDFLGQSAQRIAAASEQSQPERREEYLRMINYQLAVDKITAEQRDMLQKIVYGQMQYG